MRAKEVALGGLLAGSAFAVLYLGSTVRVVAAAACVVAGVVTAAPIAVQKKGLFWKTYLVTAGLAIMLLPSKTVATLYCLLTGVYPAVKYYVESKTTRARAWALKIAYWNAFALCLIVMARYGFIYLVTGNEAACLTQFGRNMQLVMLLLGINAAFVLYDFVVSRCQDVLRYLAARK